MVVTSKGDIRNPQMRQQFSKLKVHVERAEAQSPTYGAVTVVIVEEPGADR
jgi:hypothetical protein